jgi:DNA-binding transcriptional LysR family regulator
MELRQLKHFVAVAEELHFTRAAAKVHVVQSTLSASISGLEAELGTALLVRNNRRVDLTTAGQALLPDAQHALAAAERARAAVDAVRGLLSGQLRIGDPGAGNRRPARAAGAVSPQLPANRDHAATRSH